jgi:hypothetical protein
MPKSSALPRPYNRWGRAVTPDSPPESVSVSRSLAMPFSNRARHSHVYPKLPISPERPERDRNRSTGITDRTRKIKGRPPTVSRSVMYANGGAVIPPRPDQDRSDAEGFGPDVISVRFSCPCGGQVPQRPIRLSRAFPLTNLCMGQRFRTNTKASPYQKLRKRSINISSSMVKGQLSLPVHLQSTGVRARLVQDPPDQAVPTQADRGAAVAGDTQTARGLR